MASLDHPVCVTGATGFIGAHVVERFLMAGYTVRCTVRDPSSKKAAFLGPMGTRYGDRLTIFAADLSHDGSFNEAVQGCTVVVHTAAVVKEHYEKDPWEEVVQPGLDGVRNIITACRAAGTVKRIVFTGSVSTVRRLDSSRPEELRGTPFTEEEFGQHQLLSPTYGTYNYAKLLAEKAMFEGWDGQLISILPAWCLGPQHTNAVTSSQQVVKALACKEYPIAPRMFLDCVDVRDVARAHVAAAETKAVSRGRYIVSSRVITPTAELSAIINAQFPGIKAPTRTAPWVMLWLMSWCDKRLTKFFLTERAVPGPAFDNRRIQRELGFTFDYPNLSVTVADAVRSFIDHGIVKYTPSS